MVSKREVQEKLINAGLGKYFDELREFGRDSALIEVVEYDESADFLGRSRLGGEPDLPEGEEWPWSGDGEISHPMCFVAQIALDEVLKSVPELAELLPQTGILYFFRQESEEIGAYGLDPEDFQHCKIIYYDGPKDKLKRHPFPDELDDYEIFLPAHVKMVYKYSLPVMESPWGEILDELDMDGDEDSGEEWDAYFDIIYSQADATLLGHPEYVQGSVEVEAAAAASQLTKETQLPAALKESLAAPFGRDEKDWRVLLSVGSVNLCNMMWGDMGTIYFMITEEDLKARRYDRMICCFQCG